MLQKLLAKPWVRLVIVLALALEFFMVGYLWAKPEDQKGPAADSYAEYERGKVIQVLADNTEQAEIDDYGWRGEQLLIVEVLTGQYKGEELITSCGVTPTKNVPMRQGDTVVMLISTYPDGSHMATVYEYDRILPLSVLLVIFLAVTILVGGKTGAKSILGLLLTMACLFYILFPALYKGADTIWATLLVSCYIAIVTLCIMDGVRRKTLCAIAGTIAGVALAAVFGLVAQKLTRIDGFRADEMVEGLLISRVSGSSIRLRGLLIGGLILSSLGAVMDVTMGIASTVSEIRDANPSMSPRELFRSGMNVGRDMVGTMTNTLILAFLGSSFVLILYLYSTDLQTHELLSSSFLSVEMITGLSSSIGVILSIPITAGISALAMGKRSPSSPPRR